MSKIGSGAWVLFAVRGLSVLLSVGAVRSGGARPDTQRHGPSEALLLVGSSRHRLLYNELLATPSTPDESLFWSIFGASPESREKFLPPSFLALNLPGTVCPGAKDVKWTTCGQASHPPLIQTCALSRCATGRLQLFGFVSHYGVGSAPYLKSWSQHAFLAWNGPGWPDNTTFNVVAAHVAMHHGHNPPGVGGCKCKLNASESKKQSCERCVKAWRNQIEGLQVDVDSPALILEAVRRFDAVVPQDVRLNVVLASYLWDIMSPGVPKDHAAWGSAFASNLLRARTRGPSARLWLELPFLPRGVPNTERISAVSEGSRMREHVLRVAEILQLPVMNASVVTDMTSEGGRAWAPAHISLFQDNLHKSAWGSERWWKHVIRPAIMGGAANDRSPKYRGPKLTSAAAAVA